MQKLSKAHNSDLKDHEIELALILIKYYRRAFDIRSQGVLNARVDPPEVRELLNMLLWVGKGFDLMQAGDHLIGLQDVIQSSSAEMEKLISYVREFGANEPIVIEINYLQGQTEAADTLAGYLFDG